MRALLGAVTWCDVALPLFGSGRLDQTGSSCKAGLIAVFCERGVWIKGEGITINYISGTKVVLAMYRTRVRVTYNTPLVMDTGNYDFL
jgi:hypothetical protein